MSATIDTRFDSALFGHNGCIMCGGENPISMGLKFRELDKDSISAMIQVGSAFQGYDGIVHGGIVAALLDAAMTHGLFRFGIKALTGDLHVRYKKPIAINTLLNLEAHIIKFKPPLYRMKAEIAQNGCVLAWAEAKFMRQ